MNKAGTDRDDTRHEYPKQKRNSLFRRVAKLWWPYSRRTASSGKRNGQRREVIFWETCCCGSNMRASDVVSVILGSVSSCHSRRRLYSFTLNPRCWHQWARAPQWWRWNIHYTALQTCSTADHALCPYMSFLILQPNNINIDTIVSGQMYYSYTVIVFLEPFNILSFEA